MRKAVITRGSATHKGIKIGAGVVFAVFVLVLPFYFGTFRVFQFTLMMVFAVALLGLNLLTGYNGQISLGHSFFFAIGAYTSGILIADYGWNYLLTLPVAAAITFALGFLVGIPALRIHGLYLALVTLALAVVIVPLIKRFEGFTGGVMGKLVPQPNAPAWTGLARDQWIYFVTLAITLLMFLIARNLLYGRVGRAIIAIRDNEIAAQTMGVNLAVYKTLTFAYSGMFAGVGGGLYVYTVAFVSPESFTVILAIILLSGVVVGGMGTISGAVYGAVFIQFVRSEAAGIHQALSGFILGAIIIAIMLLMPQGVSGIIRRIRDLFVRIESTPMPAFEPARQPVGTPATQEGGASHTAEHGNPDRGTDAREERE